MYTNQNYNNKKGSLNRGGAHALWKFANELALRSFQWRATDHLWTLNLIPVWSTSRSEQMCQQPKWWGKIMSLRTKLRADGEQLPWWCDSHTWWCWCCVCVCETDRQRSAGFWAHAAQTVFKVISVISPGLICLSRRFLLTSVSGSKHT